MTPDRLDLALDQLRSSRAFTKMFLADLDSEQWFWQPAELATHIAWQVGHLAVAQYSLCLKRVRDVADADEQLIPERLAAAFRIGSVPAPPAETPPVDEIVALFERVHEQALVELSAMTQQALDAPTPTHPMFSTKLGAVEWCSRHELVHAGQIALLRRLMGKPPLR